MNQAQSTACSKGALERSHRFMRTNFEPGRSFANELDYQAQLDAWCNQANQRVHRTLRCRPIDRLASERERDAVAARGAARHRPALGGARPATALPAL
jgi:hypothetical protein